MATIPLVGQNVTFNADVIPQGTRQKLGSHRSGVVSQVTWNGRICVQVENVGVVWVDAIDVEPQP